MAPQPLHDLFHDSVRDTVVPPQDTDFQALKSGLHEKHQQGGQHGGAATESNGLL